MDERKNNKGTKGNKGGRPSKADEQSLIEKLTPLEESAYKALKNALQDEQGWAIKLFFEYLYGKPKQSIEQKNINYNQELTKEDAKIINDELEKEY
tara:strand:- start:138 stop:425 length:288 start_codon:yes stop_codon:yes gene_type:complete